MAKNDGSNKSSLSENKYSVQSNLHVPKLQPNSRLDWLGGILLDPQSKQLSITSYFNNVEPTKHINLLYLVHCGPNFHSFVIDEVGHSVKAYHPVIRHKEEMSIDKEDINANANLLLELN